MATKKKIIWEVSGPATKALPPLELRIFLELQKRTFSLVAKPLLPPLS